MKAVNGAVIGEENLTKAMKTATLAGKAQQVAWKGLALALNTALNIGAMFLFSAIVDGIQQIATYSDRLAEKASEVGSAFKESQNDIESYKAKLDELQLTIHDSSSSYEEVTQARKQLMTIQDELIDKYGDEKGAINAITDAVRGQTEELNKLTDAQYQSMINEFNKSEGWTDSLRSISGSNFDKMLEQMEKGEYKVTFAISGNEEFDKLLQNKFGVELTGDRDMMLTGNLQEVYDKLLEIQKISKNYETGNFFDLLSNSIDTTQEKLENYQEIYEAYVLKEKILKPTEDNVFDDYYKEALDAYTEYNEMVEKNGLDSDEAKHAADEYVSIINDAIKEAGDDTGIVDFFKNLNKDLVAEVNSNEFEIDFTANTDDMKNDITNDLNELKEFNSDESLKNFVKNFDTETATDEQKKAYEDLDFYANKYNMSIEQLIDNLTKLGIINPQIKIDFLDKFAPSNQELTADFESIFEDSITEVGRKTKSEWIDKLTPNKQELSDNFDAAFNTSMAEVNRKANSEWFNKLIPNKQDISGNLEDTFEDAITEVDIKSISEWFDKLNEEQQKLANSPEFIQALQNEKEKLNGATLSANNYQAALNNVEKAQEEIKGINTSKSKRSISDLVDQLDNQLSPAFDSIKDAYQNIFTDDGFTLDNVDLSMFSEIKSAIDSLNSNADLNISIDYSSFEDLVSVLSDSTSSAEEVQSAFNSLVDSVVSALNPGLAQCSKENAELVNSLLESIGVTNSEIVVFSELVNNTNALEEAGIDLANATEEELTAFANEAVSADNLEQALAILEMRKFLVNNARIDNSSDINQLLTLASSAGVATEALAKLEKFKTDLENETDPKTRQWIIKSINEYAKTLTTEIANVEYKAPSTPKSSGSGSKSKEEDKWLEAYKNKLSALQDELDKELINEREFYNKSEALMNEYLKDSPEHIKKYEEEISDAEKTLHGDWANAYQAEHDAIEDLYNDGKISIKDYYSQLKRLAKGYGFTGETVGKYGKYTKEAAEAQKELNEIAKDALDNAIKGATYLIDKQIAKYNKLKDAADKSYNAQIKALDKQIDGLNDQIDSIDDLIDDLEDQADAIDDQIELIEDQTDAIDDQIKAIENEIDNYDRLIDEKQKIIDQMQDENDERDKQIALQKAQSELDKALNNNTTSTFSGGQWTYTNNEDEVSTARENVRDAQNDINVAAIQKEIDLLNEGKDALQAQIDLFEKQKEELQDQIELFEKQKEAIQDQIDAYEKQKEAIQEQIDLIEKQKDSIQELMDKSDEYFEKMIESIEETKSRWEELSELDTNAKMMQDMEDVFNKLGYTAQDVLNMSDKTFAEFKDKYLNYMMSVKGETDSVRQALSTMANVSDIQWLDDYLAKTGVGLDSIASIDLTGAVDSIGGVNDGLQDVKDSSTDTTETIVGGMSEVTDASYNTATSISADMGVVKESTYDASKAINGGKDSKAEGESLTTALTATKATASTTVPAVSQMFDNVTSSVKDSTKAVDELRESIERLNSTKVTAPGVSVNSKTFSVKQRAKGDKRVENDEWSWTQEKGAEIIASPTRNAVFTPLNAGDTVFTNEMSENLWEWGKLNPNFLMDHMEFGKGVNATKTTINNNNSSIVMNVSLNLPNVTNDSGVEYIQKELTKLSNNLKVGKYQYFNKI